MREEKNIYATHGERVLSSTERADMSVLAPCSHEEANSRIMIHVYDASLRGCRRIKIRSNDTDVVVLAISIAPLLQLEELWVTYGSSKQVRNIPAHAIATSLGQDKASVLPMFHALTGCDTIQFHFLAEGERRRLGMYGTCFQSLLLLLKG